MIRLTSRKCPLQHGEAPLNRSMMSTEGHILLLHFVYKESSINFLLFPFSIEACMASSALCASFFIVWPSWFAVPCFKVVEVATVFFTMEFICSIGCIVNAPIAKDVVLCNVIVLWLHIHWIFFLRAKHSDILINIWIDLICRASYVLYTSWNVSTFNSKSLSYRFPMFFESWIIIMN